METIDDETTGAAIAFIERQVKEGKPFFVWMNTTRMHLYTHVRASMRGQSGMPDNEYADGMIEHDGDVGKLLKILDDLGIANDTIVVYTTDNGPHMNSWPDAAMTPFRSEKDTNWEGEFRVPAMVRWPAHMDNGIYDRIVARTREGLGQPINPHLFRDCAATSVAIDDPAHIGIASRLLGHRSGSTVERYYNQARGVEASRLMQDYILALRHDLDAVNPSATRRPLSTATISCSNRH